jgi:hypothetical protein
MTNLSLSLPPHCVNHHYLDFYHQEDAFDCGFNETALKAALRYAVADRLLTRLQYSQELKGYADFVQHLLHIDARYWETRDTMEERE